MREVSDIDGGVDGLSQAQLDEYKRRLQQWRVDLEAAQSNANARRDDLQPLLGGQADAQAALADLATRRAALVATRSTLVEPRGTTPAPLDSARAAQAQALANAQAIRVLRTALRTSFEHVSRRLLGQTATSVPLLMLPVRLETRFEYRPGTALPQALKIRVYPDDVHVDSHERELTDGERSAGQQYWTQRNAAPADAARDHAAWAALAARLGPQRAAWVALSTDPAAGQVASRPAQWSRAARASLMPDRWVALAYRGGGLGAIAVGRPIARTLAVGPSPSDADVTADVLWMSNFNQALQDGMALTLPIAADSGLGERIDRLLVLGVRSSGDIGFAATELGDLFTAHRFTNGLSLLPRTTPTNNVADQAAGMPDGQAADPTQTPSDLVYGLERTTPRLNPSQAMPPAPDRRDGHWLAWALGVRPSVFARSEHAERNDTSFAAAATTQALGAADSPLLRRLGLGSGRAPVNTVPAWGQLPAWRIGAAPYALLPVMAPRHAADHTHLLQSWTMRVAGLAGDLRRRRAVAAGAVQGASITDLLLHTGRTTAALGISFAANATVGVPADVPAADAWWRNSSAQQFALDAVALRPDWWAQALAGQRLGELRDRQALGLRIGAWGYVEGLVPAPRPVQVPGSPANAPVFEAVGSLGYQQAPSLAHAAAAAILRNGERTPAHGSFDPLAGIDLRSDRVHRARWLLEGVRQGQSLGTLLGYRFERRLQDAGAVLTSYIARCRTLVAIKEQEGIGAVVAAVDQALRALATERSLQAEWDQARAVRDGAQQRLDVIEADWAATLGRLTAQRTQCAQTLTLTSQRTGGLQQSKAASDAAKPAHGVEIEIDADGKPRHVVVDDNRADYDQWRKDNQRLADDLAAATTAQLVAAQAADVAQRALADALTRYDTDLGRQHALRERDDAQRHLGSLPVADVPRRSRDADAAASTLRTAVAGAWDRALSSSQVHRAVDGLALYRRWRTATQSSPAQWNSATIPAGELGFPSEGSAEWQALQDQLALLAEEVDAVADLSVAEGVFQLVRGNPARGGAALDVLNATAAAQPPADHEVVRTPRTGAVLTHRAVVLLPSDGANAAPWPGTADCVRAWTEPRLEAWACSLLPPAAQIVCQGEWTDQAGQVHGLQANMAGLGLSAMSFMSLAAASQGLLEGGGGELALLLTQWVREHRADVPPTAELRWRAGETAGLPARSVLLADVLELAGAWHALVASARPLDARDLGSDLAAIDIPQATARLAKAVQRTTELRDDLLADLEALRSQPGPAQRLAVRRRLLAALPWRITGSVPIDAATTTTEAADLTRQAQAVLSELNGRLNRLATLPAEADPGALADRARALLGAEMQLLPHCRADSAVIQAWLDSMQTGSGLVPGGAARRLVAATGWIHQTSHVRDGIARLQRFLDYAQLLDCPGSALIAPGQFPWQPGEPWLALPQADKARFLPGRTGTVALHPLSGQLPGAGSSFCGLMLDDWTESIPTGLDTSRWAEGTTWQPELGAGAAATEVTGLSFHFDRPNASAPNVALLAVARDAATWDLDLLQRTVMSAVDLAQSRAAPADGRAEQLWLTDELPTQALAESSYPLAAGQPWHWTKSQPRPLLGRRTHLTPRGAGYRQHWFSRVDASQAFAVEAGDQLSVYVQLLGQGCRALVVQWQLANSDWEHRAVWCPRADWDSGVADAIFPYGQRNSPARHWAGELPRPGTWVRLEAPAAAMGLEGQTVTGLSFGACDGEVAWGPAGRLLATAASRHWSTLREDQVWFGGRPPRGGGMFCDETGGDWPSSIAKPIHTTADGAHWPSHVSLPRAGMHQHGFVQAAQVLPLHVGDRLFTHVNTAVESPPRVLILQFTLRGPQGGVDWEHRAVWCSAADYADAGLWARAFPWGSRGTGSLRRVGDLPPPGVWHRLEVEAQALGLADQVVDGMAFALIDGAAAWGTSGVSRAALSDMLGLADGP